MSLSTLARMLHLPRHQAEASLYSERAARAVIGRRSLFAAGAALAMGSAFSFAKHRPLLAFAYVQPTRIGDSRELFTPAPSSDGEADGSLERPFLSISDALEHSRDDAEIIVCAREHETVFVAGAGVLPGGGKITVRGGKLHVLKHLSFLPGHTPMAI